ncbi:MAG: carbohydrate-binding protein [Deltaproteobacteria bacterium]|nr:carbohydrate-binding protein [Deltaproteobacteria bacterium]
MRQGLKLLIIIVGLIWGMTACTGGSNMTNDTDSSSGFDTGKDKGSDSGSSEKDSATGTVDTNTGTATPDSDTAAKESDSDSHADTGSDTTVETDSKDSESATVAECFGQKKCEGTTLMLCSEDGWFAYRDCALDTLVCENFSEGKALCVEGAGAATSLVLTEVEKMELAPAGIRVVFTVTKDNGMPMAGLGTEDFTIVNDETGLPFNEGGGQPVIGEPQGGDFYTILTLDMSDSMFTPEGDNNAQKAVLAAKAFVKEHVETAPAGARQHVAVYAFGSSAKSELVQDFTQDASALYTALDGLLTAGSRGGTNLYGAYMAALDAVRGVEASEGLVRRSVVFLSDGLHESGDKEAMRTSATASRDFKDVDIYTIAMPGEYDDSELKELAYPASNHFSKDDGATLIQKFDLIGDAIGILSTGSYVVGVCSPLETTSSFTVTATKATLTGQMVVTYDAAVDGWTGDVSQCDESIMADPCLAVECGESTLIPGFECGGCQSATEYCQEGVCIDDCENLFCGESLTQGWSCGTCGDGQLCSDGVCENRSAGFIEAECAVEPSGANCNAEHPGSNSNIVGDGHWDGKPYPAKSSDGNLGYTAGGSWFAFENVDLSQYSSVTIRYACNENVDNTGFSIMLDSPDGTLLEIVETDFTGGWETYQESTSKKFPSRFNGTYTVYFVAAKKDVNNGNVDWIQFNK